MSETRRQALPDIQAAHAQEDMMDIGQVLELLEVAETEFEEVIDLLFNVALHPNVLALPDEDRWAAIKTCQVVIGQLFTTASWVDLESNQEDNSDSIFH